MLFKQQLPSQLFIYANLLLLFSLSCKDSSFDYTVDVALNPYKISPLTAQLKVISNMPCSASFKVLGASPIEQSFDEISENLTIPIVGLYPDTMNEVAITFTYDGGQRTDTIKIRTAKLPVGLPDIIINTLDRSKMEPGLHGCDVHLANHGTFNSMPLIFDDQGQIRWYLDLSFSGKMISPFQRLKDGTLLMVSRQNIFEFDMLGKQLKQRMINQNYGMHHDVVALPNGNLLVCVGKRNAYINVEGEQIQSDSDFIMLYDREKGKIVKEWDLAKHLDVSRQERNYIKKGDWLHMNGLAFNEKDSTIIVSGRNQGLSKISWDDNLEWILSENKNWGKSGRNGNGFETKPYLLKAIDQEGKEYSKDVQNGNKSAEDFDFAWGPHAPEVLPNGNIIVFDNGVNRNFNDEKNYSRAVEYEINASKKTVKQIWQFGKERGESFYSSIISDVDYLAKSNNILVTSGFVTPKKDHSGKIVEIDYDTGKEVFEATLYFKTLTGNKVAGWGQTDLMYRSERLELKY